MVDELTDSVPARMASIVLDYHHPLFFSASDGPGSLPVGIQLVGIENYMMWSSAMKVELLGRNKLGFVDGSITRETYGSALGHLWDRCNAIVVLWLTGNVSGICFDLMRIRFGRSSRRDFTKSMDHDCMPSIKRYSCTHRELAQYQYFTQGLRTYGMNMIR